MADGNPPQPGAHIVEFSYSEEQRALQARLATFMDEHVYPAEAVYDEQMGDGDSRWQLPAVMEELKARAREAGLWNLFLPGDEHGAGLTNLEYAPLAEIMGRSPIGPEAFNCSAPDTGNMEVLAHFASEEHKKRWLEPLLAGEIRSGFAMTEPAVASSDATNIQGSIRREGDEYVLNARKWWTSGAGDPRCEILIFMGKTDPEAAPHKQQSMVLVPMDTPGVRVLRHLPVFGYDDAPHGHMEIDFDDVRVPVENLLLGEGRGFEIAQARLGPGRIHHCMRLIGMAERSLDAMCRRAASRTAFGKPIAEQGAVMEAIADSRIEIEQSRMLVLKTAYDIDAHGARAARAGIAMIKVCVPNMALAVIDRAIQVHGAAGVSDDFGLAKAWARARSLRLADGPDEVHRRTVARIELKKEGGQGWGRKWEPDA
jgi:acyl-CoA dehydrogenase